MQARTQRTSFLSILAAFILSLLPAQAQEEAQTISGTIDNATPYFEAAFSVSSDNSTIVLDLRPTGGDLDTVVYLLDRTGNILVENDDRQRGDVSSLIRYDYAQAGQYRVIATRYGVADGKTSGPFELNIGIEPTPTPQPLVYDVSLEAIYAAGFPQQAIQPRAQWTILAYYGADTDLESGLLHDFKEFEFAGGSRENTRILMLMDRSIEFSDASGNWSDKRLFEVGAAVNTDAFTVDSQPLHIFPDTDEDDASATGERFAQYLVWGMTHYPAERYAIAFGSHGAAWEGLIQDNRSQIYTLDGLQKSDLISIPELNAALNAARQAVGIGQFDLLINDACSMSSVEYYTAMADHFSLSLASPEVVVDPALNMTDFTNLLNQDAAQDLASLGKQLVDRYVDVDIKAFPSADIIYLTHSITNLQLFPPLVEAIENFARTFNESPQAYAQVLGEARRNTYTYSAFLGSQTKVDVGDLMKRLIENRSVPATLRDAAANVLTQLDAARLYARNGGDPKLDGLSYYNIYFPQEANFFRRRDYFEQTPLREWGLMLRNYFSVVTPKQWQGSGDETALHAPIAPRVSISGVYPQADASILTPINARTEIIGRNLASVTATYDQLQADGTYLRLGQDRVLIDVTDAAGNAVRTNDWRSGVNVVNLYWDVLLPVISDGATSANELLIFTEEASDDACVRRGVAFLEGYYRQPGGESWTEVSVIFDIVRSSGGQVGRVQRVISKSANSGALAAVNIPEGSDFVAFRSRVTPDGRVNLELGTTYYKWPADGLTYTFQPAPDGQYNFGVLATAFGGTTGFDAQQISVRNSGVAQDLRGDSALSVGYILRRPADWTTTVYGFDVVEYDRSSNCDNTQNNSVYYFSSFDNDDQPVPEDPAAISSALISRLGWQASAPTPTTIQGRDGAQFDFSYTDAEGQAWTGRAFTFYEPYYGLGMTFSAEVRQDVGGLDAAYATLSEQIAFVDITAYFDSIQDEWTREFIFSDANIFEYGYPVAWNSREEADWTFYEPSDDPNTFFAFSLLAADGRSENQIAEDIANGEIAPLLANFELRTPRAHGDNESWSVLGYRGEREGQAIRGRLYVSNVGDELAVLWFETSDDDTGAALITNVLELMADAFYRS